MKTDSIGRQIWRKDYYVRNFGFHNGGPQSVWQRGNTIILPLWFNDSIERPIVGLMTTDLQGNLLSFATYPPPAHNDASLRTAIPTSDGQGLLAGRVPLNYGQVFLLKVPLTGIEEERTVTFSPRLKVFPNPSRGWVNFQVPTGQTAKLKIYDASGRVIKETEIQNQLKLKVPAGIYFYQIQNQTQTGKIVILE